jgi:hypothetical protein
MDAVNGIVINKNRGEHSRVDVIPTQFFLRQKYSKPILCDSASG